MQAQATQSPAHPSLREHRVALRPLAHVDSRVLSAIPVALRGATGARLQNMRRPLMPYKAQPSHPFQLPMHATCAHVLQNR